MPEELQPTLSHLPNKLRIVTVSMPWLHSVTADIYVKAGSRFEGDQEIGAAHFLEHLTLRGTKTYPNKLAIAQALDRIGAKISAGTGKELADYYLKVPYGEKNLVSALELLWEIVFEPLISAKELEIERKVVLQEMERRNDLPAKMAYELAASLTWPHSPLGRPSIGTSAGVQRIKRADLLRFHQMRYSPNNIMLGLAGNFDKIDLDAILEAQFLSPQPNLQKSNDKNVTDEQSAPRIKVLQKDTQQTHLALYFRAFSYLHLDEFKVRLLATLLGGGFSSRLFQKVREKKGLAYQVGAFFRGYNDTGIIGIYAGLNRLRLKEGLVTILSEVKKLRESLVEEEELSLAKKKVLSSIALSLENPGGILSWYCPQILLKDKALTYEELCQELNQISTEDIQKVAGEVFQNNRLNLGVVGWAKEEELQELLQVE